MKKRYLSLLLGFLLLISSGTYAQCPTVDIGPDITTCSGKSVFILGSIANATGGQWFTTGMGSLSNQTDSSVVYTPSPFDSMFGPIGFTLSVTGESCSASDDLILTVLPYVISAGPDTSVCPGTPFTLNGYASNASKVTWSQSGGGTFLPNSNSLNATYIPSFNDVMFGAVLTLTVESTDGCLAETTKVINFLQDGFVDAGPDLTVCAGSPVAIQGYSNNTNTQWTTSGTGTFTNSNDKKTDYIPSAADYTSGSVVLKFISGTGGCVFEDSMAITFIPQTAVNAGPDQSVCGYYFLNTQVSPGGATANVHFVQWTTSGTGIFINGEYDVMSDYWPSDEDIMNGSVILTLAAQGECGSVQDTKEITFLPSTLLHATGLEDVHHTKVCGNSPLLLHPSVKNTQSIEWITSGSGVFMPDANTINASYIPSNDDISHGVILKITSTGNGVCQSVGEPVESYLTVDFLNGAYAGWDLYADLSKNYSGTQLNGGTIASSGFLWTTTGTGIFTPSNSIAKPVYVPSATDIASGSVAIMLQNLDSSCGTPFRDTVIITFINVPSTKISGSVQGDSHGVNSAIVSLFKETNGSYYFADSLHTVTGNYTFSNLTSGNYVVYATPDLLLNGSFLPTYLGNSKEWSGAQVVKLEGTDLNLDVIRLIPFVENTDWNTGADSIVGVVTFKDVNARVEVSSSRTVQGVTVYLLDADYNDLTYNVTDAKGMFKFSNVAEGTYFLRFEYPGIKPIIVESAADGDPATPGLGSVELERTFVVTGMSRSSAGSSVLNVYPNPASDYVHFNLNANQGFEYSLINGTGTIVAEGVAVNGNAAVSLKDLKPGLYLIKLVQNNIEYKAKIYKQ